MEKYIKCTACGGTGHIEIAGLLEDENDFMECPQCEASGYQVMQPF